MAEPLKRHPSLQPLSREHHQGLLLAWKIRTGQQNEISAERIGAYVLWFWRNILKEHFEVEEKYVFPLIGAEDPLVSRAKREHSKIEDLINQDSLDHSTLSTIERGLVNHIRFEERVLFTSIQEKLSSGDLDAVEIPTGNDVNPDSWGDNFWQKNNLYKNSSASIKAESNSRPWQQYLRKKVSIFDK